LTSALTGNPGTGKTTALRGWVHTLDQNTHKTVYLPLTTISPCDLYLPLTTISPCDLYLHLNTELGGQPSHRKSKLFHNLQTAILDSATAGRRLPVLIFDDAHHLPNKTLLELPMLLNFNMDSFDPLLLILSGHQQLAARLRSPLLRHLDQRICLRYEIPTLDENTTRSYIQHRLQLAGADASIFEPAATLAIHKTARGTLRLIDRIATDALTLAALENRRTVTEEDVYNASKTI